MSARLQTVGVIGVGAMGAPMALRLIDCGYRVIVRDIDPSRVAPLVAVGAIAADSPAAIARAADFILTVVVDSEQTDDILFGDKGIVTGLSTNATDDSRSTAVGTDDNTAATRRRVVVAMCSTVAPRYTRALPVRLSAHPVALVDTPVSGGPARARNGTLSMMIGADDATLAAIGPVLDAVASRQFRVGKQCGDGSAMKIVNNMLAGINLAAAGEALALAEAMGMDLDAVRAVVEASSGGSWIFADRVPRLIARDYTPPRAASKILMKDVSLALDEATAAGVNAAIARAAHQVFAGTVARGFGEADDAAVIEHYRARDAVIPKSDRRGKQCFD